MSDEKTIEEQIKDWLRGDYPVYTTEKIVHYYNRGGVLIRGKEFIPLEFIERIIKDSIRKYNSINNTSIEKVKTDE